jgi:hypothetical protein
MTRSGCDSGDLPAQPCGVVLEQGSETIRVFDLAVGDRRFGVFD